MKIYESKECKCCDWIGEKEILFCPYCDSDEFFENVYVKKTDAERGILNKETI
mgnify:FL=1